VGVKQEVALDKVTTERTP